MILMIVLNVKQISNLKMELVFLNVMEKLLVILVEPVYHVLIVKNLKIL